MRAHLLVFLAALGAMQALRFSEAPAGVFDTEHGKPVVYIICMGTYPYRHQTKTLVHSLRKVGQWNGTIAIVTDKPGCIRNGLGEKILGSKSPDYSDANVDVYPSGLHVVKVPEARTKNAIKAYKAKAMRKLENAKIPHPISSIIYIDEDIVVGRPLGNFLDFVQRIEKEKHTLAVFKDKGGAVGELHTGVVVQFPTDVSQNCMKAWSGHLGQKMSLLSGQDQIVDDDDESKNDFDDEQESLNSESRGQLSWRLKSSEEEEAPLHEEAEENLKNTGAALMSKSDLASESGMEADLAGPDQQALGRTGQCTKGGGIKIIPGGWLGMPTADSVKHGRAAAFNHFTHTGRMHEVGKGAMAKFFFKTLHLDSDLDPFGGNGCE